jgi:hypothetical protein
VSSSPVLERKVSLLVRNLEKNCCLARAVLRRILRFERKEHRD